MEKVKAFYKTENQTLFQRAQDLYIWEKCWVLRMHYSIYTHLLWNSPGLWEGAIFVVKWI